VTVPLWIFSGVFHLMLPLAITSLAVPLAVCAAAASQAALPRSKSRPWSRPLVMPLYFLQPIVRGWARYQGRLLPRSAPLAARQTLDSVALRESRQSLNQVDYWSQVPLDRLQYVTKILARLDQQGWLIRPDIGWSDHDVEIFGSRWSQLQLATVAEDHAQGRHLIRCRLRAHWSLQAKVLFWGLAGLELLVLGLFGAKWPWLWLLLLSMPFAGWLLHRQGRNLQSMMVVFLDQLAKDSGLIKLQPDSVLQTQTPAATRPHLIEKNLSRENIPAAPPEPSIH